MKHYVQLSHPDYRPCDYCYTMKLKDGGMVVSDCRELEYLEGTIFAFDFVDTRKWCFKYLEGLCKQIGYLGSKKFYAKDEKGKLKPVVCEFDTWNMIIGAAKMREFFMYLEGERTVVKLNGDDVVGEVVYLDDAEGDLQTIGSSTTVEQVVKVTGESTAMETQPEDEVVPHNVVEEQVVPVKVVEDQYVPVKVVEEKVVVVKVIEDQAVTTVFYDLALTLQEMDKQSVNVAEEQDFNVVVEQAVTEGVEQVVMGTQPAEQILNPIEESAMETQPAEQSLNPIEESAMKTLPEVDIGIEQEAGEGLAAEIDKEYGVQYLGQTEMEEMVVSDSEDEDFTAEEDSLQSRPFKDVVNSYSVRVKDEASFQIREIDLTHTCARQYHVDNARASWLVQRFEKSFRCDLKKSVKGFRSSAIAELGVYISPHQAFRARQKALKIIEGDTTDQYSKLWDYAQALRDKNPGSTVILQVDNTPSGSSFKRFYVCLQATKNGFMSGCRPWIGVDGCHLRGSTKGLIGAFEKVFPSVENRFCVRLLHGNIKRAGFKGQHFKKLLWKAANATTVASFHNVMLQIEEMDKKALEWLQKGKAFEDYVHSCYSVETYNSVYVHVISPMNGDDLWEKAGYIPPLPPSFAKKNKGRTQKERRFGPNEKPKRKRRGSGTVQRMEKQYCGITSTQPQLEKESAAAQKDAQPSTQFEEEMTQHDCPPSTQEDDATSSMLPTTKQGRKMLARKRPKFANNPVDDGPAQEKSTAYTISSEINVVQSSAREPPISQPSTGFHS
ncbi:hypothetical protein C2S51_008806 [Perilla frutescens var. frutescens]|nr:hypothetical protein C2S51_008806 [Perilla frutescens var. frutescens]